MSYLILATLLLSVVLQKHFGNSLSLPELIRNPPEQKYFNKYGLCSISVSRLHDAYLVEGKLAATIIKGLNSLEKKKFEYVEKDEELKKEMYNIMARRTLENAPSNFTNNPINALNFLTRIVLNFNSILNDIFTSDILMKRIFYQDLSALVDRYIREQCSCWPTSNDILEVVKAISRISSTYSLRKRNLTEGYIDEEPSFEPLTFDQVIALTHEANRNNYFDDVVDWAQFLLLNKSFSADEENLSWQSIVKIKAYALFKTSKVQEAIVYLEDIIKEAKFETKALKRDLSFFQSKLEDSEEISEKKENPFKELCNPDKKYNNDIGLQCYYQQVGTLWDRVKVEMISKNPLAYKYYKIIKEEETLTLFDLMKTLKIKMSAHQEKEGIITDSKYAREIAVVWDDDYLITKKLSQRISYLTGLEVKTYKYNTKMSSSSPFQIINYGIGGFVEPHTDYLVQNENEKRKDISAFGGDRMATWMYQLSDKVQGGQLIFVKSNITVSMEKGSGILLFNIFKNGTTNPNAEYLECPVILGSKWIGTKYIHEHGNMFKRKCQRKRKTFF